MLGKYILVGLTHSVSVALILRVLNFILPCFVTCYYTCTANLVMFLIVARATFGFTKRKFLSDKIQPENRAVLITGCDTGIGHALAKELDGKGYHVFASCLDPTGPGANGLKKRCSKRLQILELDVTKDDSVKKALDFVKENLGTSEFWAIVNNAGVLKGFTVELTDVQEFNDSLQVNTIGPVRVTKAFLPLLRQSRGRVVNLASLAGRISLSLMVPYSMSKYATVAFSDCLRQELDVWGVRVVSIEPEFFATPMADVENIVRSIDTTFSSIDEEVKSDYGEKYLNLFKMFFEYHSGIASSKVYKVLNDLELAISLEYPDSVYRPCRNVIFQTLYQVLELLPTALRDLLFRSYACALGFPKPKESGNL